MGSLLLAGQGLVHGGVGRGGREAGPVGHLASSHVTYELPPLVVSLDDHLNLGVEVTVGQADHQTLGREKHATHYLKYVLRPGDVGRTFYGDKVANTKDWHHYDQRLRKQITIDLPYFALFTFAAFQCFLS